MSTMRSRSVYQRALSPELFSALHPILQTYAGPIPSGSVGIGRGSYDFAGPTSRLLGPVLRVLAWRHVLFPESGRDVPLLVRNEPRSDGTLAATRVFGFRGRPRSMEDRMTPIPGAIVDRLGRRGGLEVTLAVEVIDGGMRLSSRRLRGRVGPLALVLPPWAGVTVDERIIDGRQHVDARVSVTGLGEVFRYTGSFTYEIVPAAPEGGPGRGQRLGSDFSDTGASPDAASAS
ncbi:MULTISPECIES: DUF4166 domain-containing protein [unclassified Microbacterium]|uniref:DUF4166 domain-containing protein n=1 Tax=unclassified Microbacterium TaxID=2609290 RepID=UPI003018FC60